MKIKLTGKVNDLELGTEENGIYTPTGLLADDSHRWKVLHWIDVELANGHEIRVMKTKD